jgi:hypothetical protein
MECLSIENRRNAIGIETDSVPHGVVQPCPWKS